MAMVGGAVTLLAAALVAGGASPTNAAEADFRDTAFFGSAWGADGELLGLGGDPLVTIDEVARQYLGCQGPLQTRNSVNGLDVDVPPALPIGPPTEGVTAGTIVNTGEVARAETSASIVETSTVEGLSLLGGVVTATAVESRVHTVVDVSGVNHHSDADGHPGAPDGSTGVTFVDLEVAGIPIENEPAPNTEIPIPGVGRVVLNEHVPFGGDYRTADGTTMTRGLQVIAVHVYLDETLDLGDIRIAIAQAKVSGLPGVLSAYGFTANARIRPLGGVGRQAFNVLKCRGTDGVPDVLTQTGVDIPGPDGIGILESATARNTVWGDIDDDGADTHAVAELENASALDGLVTADAITVSTDTVAADGAVRSTWTTEFVNLQVAGETIVDIGEVAPYTRIGVPGLGEVILNGRVCESDNPVSSVKCRGVSRSVINAWAIKVKITVPDNPLDLPVGATIKIAEASSGVVLST